MLRFSTVRIDLGVVRFLTGVMTNAELMFPRFAICACHSEECAVHQISTLKHGSLEGLIAVQI